MFDLGKAVLGVGSMAWMRGGATERPVKTRHFLDDIHKLVPA